MGIGIAKQSARSRSSGDYYATDVIQRSKKTAKWQKREEKETYNKDIGSSGN
ncbi:hypothetical protein AGMMS49990_03660 [Endomicrobiia bacterium]|nr:hypothetical protein AGMMS49990_03660 [Endomicrobiia bacterium]